MQPLWGTGAEQIKFSYISHLTNRIKNTEIEAIKTDVKTREQKHS